MLSIGTKAPDFSGRDQHGKAVSLRDFIQNGPLVLYFYPKDFTPVCTQQACLLRDAYEDLLADGATVVGVSIDDETAHKKFAAHHSLPFSLIADPDKTILKQYDALRAFGLLTNRVTYVIDQGGVVRAAFAHQLNAGAHLRDIRKAIAALPRRAGSATTPTP